MIDWLRRKLEKPAPPPTKAYRALFDPPPPPPAVVHQIPKEEAAAEERGRRLMDLDAQVYAITRGRQDE